MVMEVDIRDFGFLPSNSIALSAPIRCGVSGAQIVGQLVAFSLLFILALVMAAGAAVGRRFPENVTIGAVVLIPLVYLVYFKTRNDYAWVELDGDLIRAKHLYTRRLIERRVAEIQELRTVTSSHRTGASDLVDELVGRVRRVEIRFRDGRTPIPVSWADPAMRNAKELLEGIICHMGQTGELDLEIIEFDGRPLLRRIFRKEFHGTTGPAA